MRVIDVHTHVVHPDIFMQTADHSAVSGFGLRPMAESFRNDPVRAQRYKCMTDPAAQRADMQRRGIDIGLISTSTIYQSTSSFPAEIAGRMERAANALVAQWVRDQPDHFVGSFSLPLQDIDLSLEVMAEALALGLNVVNLPAGIAGRYLGDAYFRPLWQEIAARKVVAIVHPDGIKEPGYQAFSLWNAIGQAIEETRVMCSLIYEGLFDALGEIPIVMCHGGGYLPFYVARLDRNATAFPASMANISRLPSEYLRLFHYDTVTYDRRVIDMLIERVGADRVVFGTDYPFGDAEPLTILGDLDDETREKVAYRNAGRLLGL